MDHEVENKLETLRFDYREVTGKPFLHFFCPVLFQDEDAALCRAHIVNSAFPDSCRRWTVQRADVDSFYGSAFESDFVDLQYRGQHLTDDAITDPLLSKSCGPRGLYRGRGGRTFHRKWTCPRAFYRGPCKWAERPGPTRLEDPPGRNIEYCRLADCNRERRPAGGTCVNAQGCPPDVVRDARLPACPRPQVVTS